MTGSARWVLGATCAGPLLLAAWYAPAQTPAPLSIGERMHDLHDQRYQRTPVAPPVTPAPHQHHGAAPTAPPSSSGAHDHGTPPGWKFTLPKGDADKGRGVFVKLECYACHEVKGQPFPGVKDGANVGPELSEMAAHHEAEFFAEAITSKMPSFNDSLAVQELIDLVAFLKSLTPPAASGHKL